MVEKLTLHSLAAALVDMPAFVRMEHFGDLIF